MDKRLIGRSMIKPDDKITIELTNDELSILKQLLRKEEHEFEEIQYKPVQKAVYVKIMQTRKVYGKGSNEG